MPTLPQRPLGKSGLSVSALGLGCMGMSEFYGARNDDLSIQVIHRYFDLGGNFLDTADMYGSGHNEQLVGEALKRAGLSSGPSRDKVILATKFGNVRGPNGEFLGIRGDPAYVRQACDASLRRLGLEYIDLYYQHRVDSRTPIEDTVGAMADLVKQGKVRHLGLSEAAPDTIRRAARIHPIAALQTEYSLWTRDPEEGVLPTCRELDISFVAYSPLGRGFLTGQFKSPADLPPDDRRRDFPRFQAENFERNMALVRVIEQIAAGKRCTPAQLALAWVLSRGNDLIPIPGTKKLDRLEENLGALRVRLTSDELSRLDTALPPPAGERYPEPGMKTLHR
jgi:aryl-alcohol dehydrogenase-like predicted oxidoreductase